MKIRTPDHRVRVFISSTLGELAAERVAVRDAVERLRLTPVMFETGARPHPPRALYRAYLDQSDVFVGIYWQRYGWIAPDETVSGLEDEYRLAAGRMPQLIYIKEPAAERDVELRGLLDRIQADDRVAYRRFSAIDELAALVADDVASLLSERFAEEADGDQSIRRAAVPPAPLDETFGRRADIDAVVDLVRSGRRLVTLTGPGGIGKSRLALEAARALSEDFDDQVVFVPLASLTQHDLVVASIAERLGVRLGGVGNMQDEIAAELARRSTLLLLDNFEQVQPAAVDVVAILDRCPQAFALVTSRHVLRVHGEREYQVQPLDTTAAVELFAERAVAVRPGFSMTEENRRAVADIARRLDGLPLAIELAAACMRLVSATALVSQLSERMDLLPRGATDVPERQRTLRATMDWSYDLLDDVERRVFARLAAFNGGWTIPAAVAVCGRDDEPDVLMTLAALVEKSLVVPEDTVAEPRLRMLETVRAYAEERLADLPDRKETERRHAAWMLELLVGASRTIRPPHHKSWLEQFDRERANLRAAVQRALRDADVELVTFLVGASMGYLSLRDAEAEGGAWLEEAVRVAESAPAPVRARLLRCRAVMAGALGQYTTAKNLLRDAEGVSPVNAADVMDVAVDAMGRAVVASARESPAEALPAALYAADAMATAGSDVGEAYMWQTAGTIALATDPGSADGYLSRALDLAEAMDNDGLRGQALTLLGYSARRSGRAREARVLFLRAAAAAESSGQRSSMAYALDGLAAAALDLGDPIVAAQALASSECARSSLDRTSWAAFIPLVQEVDAGARDAAGTEAYETARADGARCDVGQALRDALDVVTAADREDARR